MAKLNWFSEVKRLLAVAIVSGGIASTALAATTNYTWTGASGANWNAAGSWSKSGGDAPAAYPDRAGDTFTSGIVGTMSLNVNVTVGQARKTSNTSPGTTISAGGGTLIMDNTGGTTNPFGTSNASISGTNSFGFTIAAPVSMFNSDLDVGATNSNGNVNISGAITNAGNTGDANAAHTLYLRANNANTAGSTQLTISGNIGATGANIAIQNIGMSNGTTTNAAVISGKLGPAVTSVEQNSALSTLVLSGDNKDYNGTTTITQGTLSLGSATALGGNGSATGVGGALIINGGALNASGGTVILTTVNAQSWNADFSFVGTNSLNLGTGAVTLGGNRIVTANNNTLTVGGVISGTGVGLTKRGAGTMNLTANNAYTGSTAIGTVGSATSGGTLQVSGAAGTINSTTGTITIAGVGSRLFLDNTLGSLERVNNAAGVRLSTGGELQLTQGNTTTNATETIGTLTIDTGYDIVTVVSASGRTTLLSAAGFSRLNNATALVRGSNLNAAVTTQVGRIQFTNTSGLTLIGTNTLNNGATGNATKGLTIVPYLIGDNSSTTTGSHFVTYDTTLGLRLLTSAQETGLAPGYTTAAAPDNALAGNNVTVTNAAGITINSLLFNTLSVNSTLISANPNPLTINSGAMASVVNQQNGIEGFSSLNFGNGEAVITVTSNTLTVSSPINVTSSGGLTKSGNGALLLRANNLYLGATIINAGTLRVGDGAVGTLNAASVVTINPQGTLQINRPTGDTFANAIVHNGTLTISTVGTQTLSGNISGVGAINASTAGNTLVLSGTNSYSGGSNVTAGVLQFNAAASIAGSGRNLSISGTGVAAAGYAIDQAFLDRIVTTSGGTAALATNSANNLDFTGLATTSLGATGAFTYTGTLTPDGTNYRVGGGAGVLTFSNTNAFTGGSNVLNVVNGIVALTATNNYGGRTNLLSGGTLRIGVADALPTGTTLSFGNGTTFGATTIGNLDVQFNQTVAGLLANTNSASANTISIAQNRTLTINGAFTVGGYTGTGSPTTVLNITGDGALMVNGDFRTNAGTDGSYLTTVDLGGLASFTATGANFLIGDTSSGVASQATSSVKLGAGTNTINTTTLALGHVKGSGAMTFSGPTGTLKVRGLDGQNVTPVTNFNVVNVTTATAASPVGTADFDGHQVDILATNLTIGNRAFAGGGAGQVSSATGTFSFNNGVVETVNLTMAQRSHSNTNAGSGNVTGELNVGGSLTATALLKVTGSTFSIGRNTATAGGIAIGTVNVLTNGTLETDANIVDTGGAGVTTTTINLNGGTLNLKGKTIGDATTPIDNLTFAAGTLANVAQINNGAAINKTTAGMLTLSGTNTFTGLTSVQAGTLKVDGTTTGAVTVDTGATLAGTGTISGVVTVNGTLAPGESLGRLTVANDVTFGSGATFAAGINGLSAGTTHDQLTIDGDFDITLGNASLLLTMGTFGVTVGQQIVLIDSNGPGSVIGQFAGLGEGAQIASLDGINGFNWNITYANDVAIVATAVPEPAGLGLIALAAAGMLRRRRVR